MFIVAILILKKPPSGDGMKTRDLKPLIQWRLNQCDRGDWRGLGRTFGRFCRV